MAEVALDIKVNSGTSVNSVKDLKAQIKELESAALAAGNAGDEALARKYAIAAGEAKDQLADFKNEIKSVQDAGSKLGAIANVGATIASGFQAAQGAAALFGSAGEDVQKVLVKVQAATALAQGAQALANATEDIAIAKKVILTTVQSAYTAAVGASTGALRLFRLALAATGIGAIVVLLGNAVSLLLQLSETTEDAARATDIYNKSLERKNELLNESLTLIDRNEKLLIAQAQAEGKSQAQILEIQKTFLNKRIDQEQIFQNQLRSLQRDLTDEEVTKLRESEERVKDISVEYQILELQRIKSFNDEKLKKEQEYLDALKKKREETSPNIQKIETKNVDELPEIKVEKQIAAKKLEIRGTNFIQELQLRARQQAADQKLAVEGVNALANIISTLPAKTEAGKKRQFELNKKFNIATTLIDTYLGAQKAYNSQLSIPTPDAPIRGAVAAGLVIAQGLARVALIRSQKYDGGGGASASGAGGGGGGGTVPAPTAPTVPTFNPQGTIIPQNNQQQQNAIKAYVLEDDISTSQNRITDIKTKALYG